MEASVTRAMNFWKFGGQIIVSAQPWNRRPHPFLEVAGWTNLARHLFKEKRGGGW